MNRLNLKYYLLYFITFKINLTIEISTTKKNVHWRIFQVSIHFVSERLEVNHKKKSYNHSVYEHVFCHISNKSTVQTEGEGRISPVDSNQHI